MIKHTVEIDNYGDYCGKCKLRWCLNPTCKGESEYLCSVFHKRLMRTVGGRRLCRLDQCIALDPPEDARGEVKIVPHKKKKRLCNAPVGLFLYPNSKGNYLCLGVKTEYSTNDGRVEAYIVDSGEFFCGGNDMLVYPVSVMVEDGE